jgi:mycothione reductase
VTHYDLIIVGTGSGNSILNEHFADWSVAIVERGDFGGTCLNVGCIPTKMFVHTADLAAVPGAASRFGVSASLDGVRWPEIRDRIFGRIDPLASGGRDYRVGQPNVTVYEDTARFVGDRKLALTSGEVITADRVVLAAGGRPRIPSIPGLDSIPFHTSDTVMRLSTLPQRMIIIGTGFVASEFAHVFSSFGVEITIIGRSGALLRHEDLDISARFTELASRRWDVRLNRKALGVSTGPSGVELQLDGETVSADSLLIAVGRVPNADLLDTETGGVALSSDGRVRVDSFQRTTAPGVWALGDICSEYELKHVANHEARVVQHNLLHADSPMESDHRFVPHAVFTSPQIASVGLTEQVARSRGIPYVSATQDYADIAYGWAMEDTTGFAKLLADPSSGLLLGAHIIGPQAATLLQPIVQAMSFGLPVSAMARGQYWIHPAMPELVENALLKLPLGDS